LKILKKEHLNPQLSSVLFTVSKAKINKLFKFNWKNVENMEGMKTPYASHERGWTGLGAEWVDYYSPEQAFS